MAMSGLNLRLVGLTIERGPKVPFLESGRTGGSRLLGCSTRSWLTTCTGTRWCG